MGWGSLLKAFGKWSLRGGKAAAESVGNAAIHPQRTIKGLGTATKTAVAAGGATYVGWKKLTTDDSVVGIVSDAVIGKDTTEKIGSAVGGAADDVKDLKDSVGSLTKSVGHAVDTVESKWNGLSNFLQGIFSGNGGNMIGNFFSNLGQGNVSGLSLAGLVLSSLLVFGRFGWMGKIAGAVLGMMMIGNNANMSQVLSGNNEVNQEEEAQQSQGGGMRR